MDIERWLLGDLAMRTLYAPLFPRVVEEPVRERDGRASNGAPTASDTA